MWEQINRFYLTVRGTTIDTIWRRQPHEFFRSVKEAIHFFQGLTDSTLGHAEGWQLPIQAGRFLERRERHRHAARRLLRAFRAPTRERRRSRPRPDGPVPRMGGSAEGLPPFRGLLPRQHRRRDADRITEFLLLDPVFRIGPFSIDRSRTPAQRDLGGDRRRVNAQTGWPAVCRRPSATAASMIMAESLASFLTNVEKQCVRIHDASTSLHQLSHRNSHGGLSTHHMEYGIRHITRFRYHAAGQPDRHGDRLHPRTEGANAAWTLC